MHYGQSFSCRTFGREQHILSWVQFAASRLEVVCNFYYDIFFVYLLYSRQKYHNFRYISSLASVFSYCILCLPCLPWYSVISSTPPFLFCQIFIALFQPRCNVRFFIFDAFTCDSLPFPSCSSDSLLRYPCPLSISLHRFSSPSPDCLLRRCRYTHPLKLSRSPPPLKHLHDRDRESGKEKGREREKETVRYPEQLSLSRF